mgnify:FL=1
MNKLVISYTLDDEKIGLISMEGSKEMIGETEAMNVLSAALSEEARAFVRMHDPEWVCKALMFAKQIVAFFDYQHPPL